MRYFLTRIATVILCCLALKGQAFGATAIGHVSVDRASFNPTAGEAVVLTIAFLRPGRASVAVVDRDGFLVRRLATEQPVSGSASFKWDGRDVHSVPVADEAYSFRIEWRGHGAQEIWFPADRPSELTAIDVRYFDRRSGTLAYTLPRASRVHIQAGTAIIHSKQGTADGPVLKTIVNREPRVAGAIAEHWNGFDESGAVFVADLENFAVAIAAAPLPEDAVITYGNRHVRFVDEALTRTGTSLFRHNRGAGRHHGGLTTLNDVSPELTIEPIDATWSAADKIWIVHGRVLRARLSFKGPTATTFLRQPARVFRFIDGQQIGQAVRGSDVVEVPLRPEGTTQRISINWQSDWGPLAANTVLVRCALPLAKVRGAR